MKTDHHIVRPARPRAWDKPVDETEASLQSARAAPRRARLVLIGGAALAGVAIIALAATLPIGSAGPSGEAPAMQAALDEPDPASEPETAAVEPAEEVDAGEMTASIDPGDAGEETAAIETLEEDSETAATREPNLPAAGEARFAGALPDDPGILSPRASELASALENLAGDNATDAPPAALAAFSSLVRPDNVAAAASGSAAGSVVVAESEGDVLALEEEQSVENEAVIAALREDGTAYSSADPVAADTVQGLAPARVSAWVNLRDRPANDSNVLTVVPADATVQASSDCPQQWCQVSYDGRSGYIYQGYVRHAQ